MADLVVRGLDDELVRKVRSSAAMDGRSVKEWVCDALASKIAPNDTEVKAQPTPEPVVRDAASLVPGAKCYCGAGVEQWMSPESRVTKWKCTGSPAHFLTPREIQS